MTAQQIHLACQFSWHEKSSKVIRILGFEIRKAHMKKALKYTFMDGIFPVLNCRQVGHFFVLRKNYAQLRLTVTTE